jgi:hypothetical protein
VEHVTVERVIEFLQHLETGRHNGGPAAARSSISTIRKSRPCSTALIVRHPAAGVTLLC